MKRILVSFFALAIVSGVWAGQGDGAGTVVDIKKDAERIKIKHGPIEGLMDGMTMEFELMDPAMLDDLSAGDNINFTVEESDGGRYVITDVQVTEKGSTVADN